MRPPPSRPSRLRRTLLSLAGLVLTLRPAPLAADPAAYAGGDLALGPVVYRCLGLEPLRLAALPADDAREAAPRLGPAGRWRPVPWAHARAAPRRARDGPPDHRETSPAEALLLAELHEADGGHPTDDAEASPPPRPGAGRDAVEFHWFLVATWEASALAVLADPPTGSPRRRVVAARRAVALPLPPPDLRAKGKGPAPTGRAATPWWIASWRAADLRAPPPHPDPDGSDETQGPQPARRRAPRGPDAGTAGPVRDFAHAVLAARRGDTPGADRAFATRAAAPDPAIDVLLDAAWRAEVDASLGRFPEAAARYGRAAVAIRASDEREVAAWLASRVAVLRRRAGLALGEAEPTAVPWPFGALDARGDVVAPRAPPEDPGETRGAPLPTARRATAAWWAARRAATEAR